MAGRITSCVNIFDDFEEPQRMDTAFCKQVSEQEYTESVTSETDKALGELCLLLDKNPELYARVVRKRKREEVENDGLVSFMKSKVLGLVHGDNYAHSLVSDLDCVTQTSALKAGICRTFQYAQEIKSEPVRQSQRLASKHKKKAGENADQKSSSTSRTRQAKCTDGGDRFSEPAADNGVNREPCSKTKSLKFGRDRPEKNGKDKSSDEASFEHDGDSSMKTGKEESTVEGQFDVMINQLVPAPSAPPPPPPPLPVSVTSNMLGGRTPTIEIQKLADSCATKTPIALQNISSNAMNSLSSVSLGNGRRASASPRQSKSDNSLCANTEMTKRLRSRQSLLSNSAARPVSMGSLTSIHSELLASNHTSRLKATQITRSPGGTPQRPRNSSRLPSEPLHKALVTAVRSKFKNVYTPSPRSAFSSNNNSGTFSFSP